MIEETIRMLQLARSSGTFRPKVVAQQADADS